MAYYIISFAPVAMKKFQEKHSFLKTATWIKDQNQLKAVVSSPSEGPIFFVHFSMIHAAVSELVMEIRASYENAKILYVLDDTKGIDLKSHQLTPVGGDLYIQILIESNRLISMLQDISPNVKISGNSQVIDIAGMPSLKGFKEDPSSVHLDTMFSQHLSTTPFSDKPSTLTGLTLKHSIHAKDVLEVGVDMSDKDQELSLDDLGDLELGDDDLGDIAPLSEEGLDLNFEESALELGSPAETPAAEESTRMDLNLDEISLGSEDESPDLSFEESSDEPAMDLSLGETSDDSDMDLSLGEVSSDSESTRMDLNLDDVSLDSESTRVDFNLSDDLSLDDDLGAEEDLKLGDDSESTRMDINLDDDFSLSLDADEPVVSDNISLDSDDDKTFVDSGFKLDDELSLAEDKTGISDDARTKLREIDAIMGSDDSDMDLDDDYLSGAEEKTVVTNFADDDLDTSLVSDDLDLGSINFGTEEKTVLTSAPLREEKPKKQTKKEAKEVVTYEGNLGKDLKELSQAYSGEMERMQATVSNLRMDREELLAKIQKFEEERVGHNRQMLSLRAELDEKKIELSIIRKKLNDEIAELKDRLKLYEEKKLILEEKYKILVGELDKVSQKNKFDVKKVQMRERELEQKLELLKADSETQIRHRDLKILELKRKLDAMEFDIESISVQEKRSVESRFELEDKLGVAIKTLRNAITVLEDETEKSNVLEALKKNIDM